ncbi:peroxiredoxin [Candidatus Atelocyanobacterium thalassae]|uniref:thioredoxin-dependent peroxiredoxin n=1 Tax=cyanobacterium endosymbiont of Braarudosphaera bigelowii TaxID=1285375 RepID=A0ABN6K0Y2_9CHRO|nr:peroxiredoxin [Candidatus Atelocyanobacterium thalassa]BDA40194.1 putative peroxiredoxin bcp [cyanobacterium endosymbiont of Braarudosphaera bigelowii]
MTLAVKTIAPNFTAFDEKGIKICLSDYRGKIVVLYFYPKDDTPGCTQEAQSFQNDYEKYQNRNIIIFGVSMDSQESHKTFKEKFNLPFQLLADEEGILTKLYDVAGENYSRRVTYIINETGIIDHVDEKINTKTHAQDVLKKISQV